MNQFKKYPKSNSISRLIALFLGIIFVFSLISQVGALSNDDILLENSPTKEISDQTELSTQNTSSIQDSDPKTIESPSASEIPPASEESDPDAINKIKVTFEINNSDYTKDPASDETHIFINKKDFISDMKQGDLTFNLIEDEYSVEGTGILTTYEILPGTSLADNDLESPILKIKNSDSNNQLSFKDNYSWVDKEDKIYEEDYIFEEDTTLELLLDEKDSESLDALTEKNAETEQTEESSDNNLAMPTTENIEAQADSVKVTYDLNITKTPISSYDQPKVNGEISFSHDVSGTYTVLAPSPAVYHYKVGDKYLGEATFDHWEVTIGKRTNKFNANATINDITTYNSGNDITFKAIWSFKDSGSSAKNGSMVNFFVSREAISQGTLEWENSIATENFTDSVHVADVGVTGTEGKFYGLLSLIRNTVILGADTGGNLEKTHEEIKSNLTNGFVRYGNINHVFQFQPITFPEDETILQRVREWLINTPNAQITINGHSIQPDELTSSNFTIRWNVFKYVNDDAWHVDGILVAKKSQVKITKTFAGDPVAIEEIQNKDEFKIHVNGKNRDDTDTGIVHSKDVTLKLSDENCKLVDQTYTWLIDVDQYYNYTITENSYQYSKNDIITSAKYKVKNSNYSDQNTGSVWKNYTEDGVTVTGSRGKVEGKEPLTVDFSNTYTQKGTITLKKIDAATGNPMVGISFTINNEDKNLKLYSVGNNTYSDKGNEEQLITGNEITTDKNGQAYLKLEPGDYTLREKVPAGYIDPGQITFDIAIDDITDSTVIGDITANNKSHEFVENSENQLMMTIKNYSELMDVEVTKLWDKDTDPKDVKIQLMRNGNELGTEYIAEFSEEAKSLTRTFENLPRYVDGKLAEYSISEIQIGEFSESLDEFDDGGYQYYIVDYAQPIYYKEKVIINDQNEADKVVLQVTNKLRTGSLEFKKINELGEPIADAVFRLYEFTDDEGIPKVIVDNDGKNYLSGNYIIQKSSNVYGKVNFGTLAVGKYYLIEHQAADGYINPNDLYKIELTAKQKIILERWVPAEGENDGGWVTVEKSEIINKFKTVDITIKKEVKGNLGERNKEFKFVVTSDFRLGENKEKYELSTDGKTATFSLKHGESITLNGVKQNSALKIVEKDADDYEKWITVDGKEVNWDENGNVRIEEDNITLTIFNKKSATEIPDLGIHLDNLPYIVMLILAVAGISIFAWKKNKYRKEQ